MPKLDIFSTKAKKLETISVSNLIFNAKINPSLMNQTVRVYLSNQRLASARTKDRNDINVTHAKVWRQKGTGRARHGSRNAPTFVGGSKTHGPSGFQTFSKKMPQKMKQLSLFSALTVKFKDKQILVVDGLEKIKPSTKAFDKIFHALVKQPQKLLLLIDQPQPAIKTGVNNLKYLQLYPAASLNTYQVLNSNQLIFTKSALKTFTDHYAA